jgi:hypothetical protein
VVRLLLLLLLFLWFRCVAVVLLLLLLGWVLLLCFLLQSYAVVQPLHTTGHARYTAQRALVKPG